jgi:hypothetical protein
MVIVTLAVLTLTAAVAIAQESIIVGGEGDDTLAGTAGPDSIYGRGGNDYLFGLGGDDELDGGSGADGISGGPGDDSVAYAGAAVTVTLDGVPDDGAAGEGDNVAPDVEDAYGTDGPDKLVGNAQDNTLDGLAGNDQITGGAGADGLYGGEGDDNIDSRDGSADRVECGPGTDTAIIDVRDSVIECESVGRVPTTEYFQVSVVGNAGSPLRRASRFLLSNIQTGSRVTFACVSRCRPRTPSNRVHYRRTSLRSSGGSRRVTVRVRRSHLVAGATFEIGVKARKARPRCRRFKLASRRGVIVDLIASKKRCTSIARAG